MSLSSINHEKDDDLTDTQTEATCSNLDNGIELENQNDDKKLDPWMTTAMATKIKI